MNCLLNSFPTTSPGAGNIFKSGLYSLSSGWVYRLDASGILDGAPIGSPLSALSYVRSDAVSEYKLLMDYLKITPHPVTLFFCT